MPVTPRAAEGLTAIKVRNSSMSSTPSWLISARENVDICEESPSEIVNNGRMRQRTRQRTLEDEISSKCVSCVVCIQISGDRRLGDTFSWREYGVRVSWSV